MPHELFFLNCFRLVCLERSIAAACQDSPKFHEGILGDFPRDATFSLTKQSNKSLAIDSTPDSHSADVVSRLQTAVGNVTHNGLGLC